MYCFPQSLERGLVRPEISKYMYEWLSDILVQFYMVM